MAKKWTKFPHADKAYAYERRGAEEALGRDCTAAMRAVSEGRRRSDAWRHYHAGEFQQAVEAGQTAGGAGINVANKAQAIYANYLEKPTSAKLALFEEAPSGPKRAAPKRPKDANAHYLYALRARPLQPGHLGREGARAGPRRQDQGGARDGDQARAQARRRAHRVRRLPGRSHRQGRRRWSAGMTYGAKKDSALEHFQKALKLNPDSAIARIEYANGLITAVRQGERGGSDEALRAGGRVQARRRDGALDVELARAELDCAVRAAHGRTRRAAAEDSADCIRRALLSGARRHRCASGGAVPRPRRAAASSARSFSNSGAKRSMTRSGSGHSLRR